MKKTAVYNQVARFSDGSASATDEERSGWPTMKKTLQKFVKFA
jgi:hypothetical protein